MKKEYSNGEITLIWQPELCSHSRKCWKELGSVFKPMEKPWIDLNGAESSRILEQVRRCPSGALSVKSNTEENAENFSTTQIHLVQNGPLLIKGKFTIVGENGSNQEMDQCALCRCGASKKKPFCDGSHSGIGFTS